MCTLEKQGKFRRRPRSKLCQLEAVGYSWGLSRSGDLQVGGRWASLEVVEVGDV